MGFGKSFGLGLLMYLLLNFGMSIVVVAISNPSGIVNIFTLEGILAAMLAPVLLGLTAFTALGSSAFSLDMLFMALLLILPGLLGALVAGKSSDSAGAAFGGWVLAAIITSVLLVVLLLVLPGIANPLGTDMQGVIFGSALMVGMLGGMFQLYAILSGLTVGFLWGGIAAVTAGP